MGSSCLRCLIRTRVLHTARDSPGLADEEIKITVEAKPADLNISVTSLDCKDLISDLDLPPQGLQNQGNTCFAAAALMPLLTESPVLELIQRKKIAENQEIYGDFLTLAVDKSKLTRFLSHFPNFSDQKPHCAHSFLIHFFMKLGGKSPIPTSNKRENALISVCREHRDQDIFDMFGVVTQWRHMCSTCFNVTKVMGEMGWTVNVSRRKTGKSGFFSVFEVGEREYERRVKEMRVGNEESARGDKSLEEVLQWVLSVSLLPASVCLSCPTCHTDTQHFRQQELLQTGFYLLFHLERCSSSEANSPISVPLTLHMSQFNPVLGKYELLATVCHSGTADVGHYWVNIRRKERWFLYNDEAMTEIDPENALNSSIFMAFYRKIV